MCFHVPGSSQPEDVSSPKPSPSRSCTFSFRVQRKVLVEIGKRTNGNGNRDGIAQKKLASSDQMSCRLRRRSAVATYNVFPLILGGKQRSTGAAFCRVCRFRSTCRIRSRGSCRIPELLFKQNLLFRQNLLFGQVLLFMQNLLLKQKLLV